MSLTTQVITKVYHNIVTERTVKSVDTPMQTDLNTFLERMIANVELVINQNGAPVTLDLAFVKNKRT